MTDYDVRLIAATAGIDPRTAHRVLVDGRAPRSRKTRQAIAAACRVHGFEVKARALEGAT